MTTKRSYEDQLSMMSDHLCSMNETLTKQREEIDTLKMASKVSRWCWHGALAAAGRCEGYLWCSCSTALGQASSQAVILTLSQLERKLQTGSFKFQWRKNSCEIYMWERASSSLSLLRIKFSKWWQVSTVLLFACGENGAICKSSWWCWVVMIKFWVEVSLPHSFWLQQTLSLAAGLFLCFSSIF